MQSVLLLLYTGHLFMFREDLMALTPVTSQLPSLHSSGRVRGVIVTVKGSTAAAAASAGDNVDNGGVDGSSRYDFASRYFAPWVGINEDPVTGWYDCIVTCGCLCGVTNNNNRLRHTMCVV